MTRTTDSTTVTTSTEVGVTIERAFEAFTDIGRWWDEDKHILSAPLAEMVLERHVGGRIIDRGTDGSECAWGRILAYDPPRRLCFSWDINTSWQIETDPTKCSEVDIEFTSITPDRTRVTLTHRHLDRHGDSWTDMRDAVDRGWSLDRYAETAQQQPE